MVVLVEDSETDAFLVKEAISAHGLNVELHVLQDGEQAIRLIAKIDSDPGTRCPHLFLLDLNLPRMSGLEVLAQIRRSPRCASLPVVLITSSDADKDRTESAALGVTAYFRKPHGYEAYLKLGEVIRKALS